MHDLREMLTAKQSELEKLHLELARRAGHIDAIEVQLKVRSGLHEDLRQVAENLDAQLLARDEEIAELRRVEQSLREELKWRWETEELHRQTEESLRQTEESLRQTEESLRQTEESLKHAIEDLQQRLATVETTRLWRWGQRYWLFKGAVQRVLRGNAR